MDYTLLSCIDSRVESPMKFRAIRIRTFRWAGLTVANVSFFIVTINGYCYSPG
jgi:hypothetical protein